jgi:hypothetical protein
MRGRGRSDRLGIVERVLTRATAAASAAGASYAAASAASADRAPRRLIETAFGFSCAGIAPAQAPTRSFCVGGEWSILATLRPG